jgi:hypothetical protein
MWWLSFRGGTVVIVTAASLAHARVLAFPRPAPCLHAQRGLLLFISALAIFAAPERTEARRDSSSPLGLGETRLIAARLAAFLQGLQERLQHNKIMASAPRRVEMIGTYSYL